MNRLYVTGDTHSDVSRFATNSFFEQKELDKSDVVVITGDFGLVWSQNDKDKTENYWLDWLDNKPFTTVFVDGNHENFDRLDNMPVSTWNNGKVHKLRDSVMHLMRGEIYDVAGTTLFAFGGAPSHDINGLATPEELKSNYAAGILDKNDKNYELYRKKLNRARLAYRVNHVNWWKQEMPNDSEMDYAWQNLEKHDFKVDYVFTHEAPASDAVLLGYHDIPNNLSMFLEDVRARCEFKHWFFGHYHENKRINLTESCLYEQIIRVK